MEIKTCSTFNHCLNRNVMENLLSTLSTITAYSTKSSFDDVCWHALTLILGCKEVDDWTAEQRDHFMVFTQYFIKCGEAVFTVKDALIRDSVTDLNSKLATELVEHLDWLEDFNSGVEYEELNDTIDEYTEMVLCINRKWIESDVLEFAANHFKFFFLTVYGLKIKERIDSIRTVNHHKNVTHE